MAESRYGERISTFQEAVEKNFTFKVDPLFHEMLNSSGSYKDLERNLVKNQLRFDFEKLASEKVVMILTCNAAVVLYHDTKEFFNVK